MNVSLSSRVRDLAGWLGTIPVRADRFFIDDSVIVQGVDVLGGTRTSIFSSLVVGVAMIAAIGLNAKVGWSTTARVALASIATLPIVLPFLLRRTAAIVHLGHGLCAVLLLYGIAAPLLTGAPNGSALVVAPVVPAIAAAGCRGRSCAAWGAATVVALGIVYLALALGVSAASPEISIQQHNRIVSATFATIVLTGVGSLSRVISDRSIEDVANHALTSARARDAHYRALLEHASEGICVFDTKARTVYASPAIRRLFDLEDESLDDRSLPSFVHPDDLADIRSSWFEVLADPGRVVRFQVRGRGGERQPWKNFDVILSSQVDTPGVHGVVVYVRDVTELREADRKYRSLIDASPSGIAVAVGDAIVYANQVLADIVGVDFEKLRTSRMPDLLLLDREQDRSRIADDWYAEAAGGAVLEPVAIRNAKTGIRFVGLRWMEIVWEGRPARQIIVVDRTAEHRLDQARNVQRVELETLVEKRTQELEISQRRLHEAERLASLGTLAAGVAHQINNPIGSILACAELALLEIDSDDRRSRVRFFEDIRAQAIRCGRISHGLLQFARKQSGLRSLGRIADVVRNAVDVCAPDVEERSATIEIELGRDFEAAWIMMDSIQMEQVFSNLIRNAIESRPEGVRVRIEGEYHAGEALTRITDDGPGIAEAEHYRIFEPFYTTRLFQGGTGLGLSVAHGIVKAHGGSLRHELEFVAGARFLVRLPALLKPPSSA